MGTILNIGLDLGTDRFKAVFAYKDANDKNCYGKFLDIPAIACFDQEHKKWHFGCDADGYAVIGYKYIVRIKELLAMVGTDAYTAERFPQFRFPRFAEKSAQDAFFEAENTTPKQVCEAFFAFVKNVALPQYEKIGNVTKKRVAIMHPAIIGGKRVGSAYQEELKRLICGALGHRFQPDVDLMLSTNKALAYFISEGGLGASGVPQGEPFLVFDLGEEQISVVRATWKTDGDQIKAIIDGPQGHNPPRALGGFDIDEALASYITEKVKAREILGLPSFGAGRNNTEQNLYGNQYLFLKELKSAKRYFLDRVSVPITLRCEVDVYCELARDEAEKQLKHSVFDKIFGYVQEELTCGLNQDVKHIVFAGGTIETYALLDYLTERCRSQFPRVRVHSFCEIETFQSIPGYLSKEFEILPYESSSFAPAFGGAMAALKGAHIPSILSRSYATFANLRILSGGEEEQIPVIVFFANRGDEIVQTSGTGEKEEYRFYAKSPFRLETDHGAQFNDYLYTTVLTPADLTSGKYSGERYTYAGRYFKIGALSRERDPSGNRLLAKCFQGHFVYKCRNPKTGETETVTLPLRFDARSGCHQLINGIPLRLALQEFLAVRIRDGSMRLGAELGTMIDDKFQTCRLRVNFSDGEELVDSDQVRLIYVQEAQDECDDDMFFDFE